MYWHSIKIFVVAGIAEAVSTVGEFYKQASLLTHWSSLINDNDVVEWKCADQTVLGYNGVPDDVASLVSYLASKEAHFITGELLFTFQIFHRLTRSEFRSKCMVTDLFLLEYWMNSWCLVRRQRWSCSSVREELDLTHVLISFESEYVALFIGFSGGVWYA